MTKYVATISTPGYLPDVDDPPPAFDTAHAAWEYLREEHAGSWNDVEVPGGLDDPLPEPWAGQYHGVDAALTAASLRPGTVQGPTPGYTGEHDLGVAYSVTAIRCECAYVPGDSTHEFGCPLRPYEGVGP